MYAMEPVFAMAFGAIWLKEELQWNKLLGAEHSARLHSQRYLDNFVVFVLPFEILILLSN